LEELQKLINQYAVTGRISLNSKDNWTRSKTILINDVIVGSVVNNLTGVEAETAVFKIHYGKNGAHIVPDYPSKKSPASKSQ